MCSSSGELPREIVEHPLHPNHKLTLRKNPSSHTNNRLHRCRGCRETLTEFSYRCSLCEFDLHTSCALSSDTKLDHPCHEHPLTLVRRPSTFTCDACWEGRDGPADESYVCAMCQVWIHKRCALLPEINSRQDHDHPLSLAYSVPSEFRRLDIHCDYCGGDIPSQSWVYYCGPCRYIFHLGCFEKYNKPSGFRTQGSMEDIVKIPTSVFGEVIKYAIQEQDRGGALLDGPKKVVKVVSLCEHEHSIVSVNLQNNVSNPENTDITCILCNEPIASSSCSKCEECNHVFHLLCARLLEEVDDLHELDEEDWYRWPPPDKMKQKLSYLDNLWSRVKCYACGLNFSGYFYGCGSLTRLDVKCASLPTRVMHKAHKHPLQISDGHRNPNVKCRSCGEVGLSIYYYCWDCRFELDHRCITLPESVKHRWDKHPLLLSFPPFSDRPGEFYCEVCEEEIHPRLWHYYCRECDRSFHPYCIPAVVYRNCTFGVTLKYDKHQQHPLKLVREGDYHSKCDSCHKSTYDKVVFECASCRFYLCFTCASGFADSKQILG